MCKVSFLGRVVLLFVVQRFSLSVKTISRRDVLRLREEQFKAGVERQLPQLRLHTVLHQYDECVRVRLCVEASALANKTLKIHFTDSETEDSYTVVIWKKNSTLLWSSTGDRFFQPHPVEIQTHQTPMTLHQTYWILRYDCFPAQPGYEVNVSVYSHYHMLISASYIVDIVTGRDNTMPKASISVDKNAKHIIVNMQEIDRIVKVRLCYKHSHAECNNGEFFDQIDPRVNQSVTLSFPYLVPCVCVQLWYTGTDTRRNTQCPFKDKILSQGGDILSSSSVRVLHSVLHWEPLCPSDQSDPSVSLCWFMNEEQSHCFPAPNSTLHGKSLTYNVSAVDKHPQMCVKFSLNGSHQIFCPFVTEGKSEWSVTVIPGSLHLRVQLTSNINASFAAQLCARENGECVNQGHIISQHVDEGATETELSLPFPFLSSRLCVQVWRSDPFLHGRRLICPDYTHRRWGLIIGTALTLLGVVTILLCITCYLIKRSTSVWHCAEKTPVLLLCSSDDMAHVTAVCSLASCLQRELFMDVRLAQWAQSSLAELGPVPWLNGQCQAVQKAGGIILIAWSRDAYQTYLRWRKSNSAVKRKDASKICNTGMYRGVEDWSEEDDKMWYDEEYMEKPRESSSIIAPVFNASLSCLWRAIHSDGHGRGFGFISFQALKNSSHIPKHLRCVRRYSLPRDLSSLIHDLGMTEKRSQDEIENIKESRQCWPRLLSKALSCFVSRKLAPRLEAGLPVSDSSKLFPKFSLKLSDEKKRKTSKHKKHKVISSCLSRKACMKKNGAAEKELLEPQL